MLTPQVTVLTPRQQEIATLVARGMKNREIAQHAGIAVQTVKDHIYDAASRIPGDTFPRHKLTMWFFQVVRE